ncbi:ATPase family AAA domain-containing protein 3C [Metarhizium brunneum]|uniref:ATPase family AAA domain-containing protein 3C n=1 Tax=Metarhizium brunneum TaxID=500148 RepID=A0A7D5YSD0_9HYPO
MDSNKKAHVADMSWPFSPPRPTAPTSPATSIASDTVSDREVDSMASAERFVNAIEKLITAKLSDNPSSSDEAVEPVRRTVRPSRASTLAFKRVEEAWDDKTYKYKIVEAAKSSVGDLDQYVFVVRERIDRRTCEKTPFIDIKSPSLRDILREACRDIRGVSLAEDAPSVEQNVLFHVRRFLRCRQDRAVDIQDTVTQSHLDLLVGYIDTTFRSVEDHLSALLVKGEITYDLLWALFEPNTEVYTTCPGTGAPRCVLYNHCEEMQEMDGSKFMHLETRFLSTNGKFLGEASDRSRIPFFRGAKRIELLPAYPLQYHPNRERVARELTQCGRRFVSLIGAHHRQYIGTAFYVDKEGEIVKRHVKGRIMVDAVCFQEQNPNHPVPRVRNVRPRLSDIGPGETASLEHLDVAQLEEIDLLICSATVLGFCLGTKTFLEFAVAHISDISWSPSSYEDVKMPEQQKKPIWALAETFLSRDKTSAFKDLIQGKGRGINFLLYGPPGVGKTLTAETIAESYKRPLYTVPAGQIGVDPVGVERVLTTIFKIASRWKAILLLDEADVFLAQRSDSPHANALVSVFLRELEQYDGILFLTTNRVQSFDEAMISRIHLALHYEPLGKDARKAVWQYFLEQAITKSGTPDCQKLIDSLADVDLNGRELWRADLKALSRTSRYMHELVASKLWQSVAIKPRSEYDLHRISVAAFPQSCLQLAKEVHFRSEVQYATIRRCPHAKDHGDPWRSDDDDDDDINAEYNNDEDSDDLRFVCLTKKAESLLRRLEDTQLRSFSWNLGTCVPPEILGADGVIPQKQPLIRSLRLTTDFTCLHYFDAECGIDLSRFRQLRQLSWKAPNADNLDTLSVAIRNNSTHLEKLELDFVHWQKLQDDLGYYDDNDDTSGILPQNYFIRRVLFLNKRSPRPLLPANRVLLLSQVPIAAEMTDVINFDILVSLTLRICLGWDRFLQRVIQLNVPINLKTLEIQESSSVSCSWTEDILADFLNAFEGLEELYISHVGPVPGLGFWNRIIHRHTTLKRFVHHQRTIDIDDESPHFEEEHDLSDLAILGRELRQIKEAPSQNPLAWLNLEFIGLACVPERLKYLLLPFKSKTSLKVLHIRQSGSDLKHYASWAVEGQDRTSRQGSVASHNSMESVPWTDSSVTSLPTEMEDATVRHEAWLRHRMRNEFCRFAEWVFGPYGISSLQIMAFGDFAYGGRSITNNFHFGRNTEGNSHFRLLSEYEPEWKNIRDEYLNALGACPVEPLLGD